MLGKVLLVFLLLSSFAFAQWDTQHSLVGEYDSLSLDYPVEDFAFDADTGFTRIGEWRWGPCYAAAVQDHYLYMGNGRLIQIFDITDPTSPVFVTEVPTTSIVLEIKFRDTLAYILEGNGFYILKMDDPFTFSQLGYIKVSGPWRLEVDDSLAYITNWGGGGIVDITNPSSPVVLRTFGSHSEQNWALAAKNRFIYYGGWSLPGLIVLDARDPSNLQYVTTLDVAIPDDAEIVDSLLYLAASGGFIIYNISDPYNAVMLSEIIPDSSTIIPKIEVVGNRVFTYTPDSGGLVTIDVSNPNQPTVTGFLPISINASSYGDGIMFHNNYLYIPSHSGLIIVNAENRDSLYQTGFLQAAGDGPKGIILKDNYALVTLGDAGLVSLDISDKVNPRAVSFTKLPGDATQIKLKGDFVYVLCDGITVLDVSEATLPLVVSNIQTSEYVADFSIDNQRLYVLENSSIIYESKLFIYDISNLDSTLLLAQHPFRSFGFDVKNSIMYVWGPDSGFVILDVSKPDSIWEYSKIEGDARSGLINDTLAYVLISPGMSIINIADPFNPIVRGSVTGGAGSLSLSGDYLYMGGGWLICVYIANTLSPQVVTAVDVPFFTPSISARHPYVFACRRNAGIFIYHNDNTVFVNTKNSDIFPDFLLEQNFPNPFNPKTDVRYEIRDASHVTLQVFDLLGREITTIVNENQYPGSYTVAWDASEMPTGIYLYRLNVINGKGIKFFSIKKMVLLR